MVTVLRCWWLFPRVSYFKNAKNWPSKFQIGHEHLKIVTNINRLQHRCSLRSLQLNCYSAFIIGVFCKNLYLPANGYQTLELNLPSTDFQNDMVRNCKGRKGFFGPGSTLNPSYLLVSLFGYIVVGDGCWIQFVLVTSLRCLWTIWDVGYHKHDSITNIAKLSPMVTHHHKVTNITFNS